MRRTRRLDLEGKNVTCAYRSVPLVFFAFPDAAAPHSRRLSMFPNLTVDQRGLAHAQGLRRRLQEALRDPAQVAHEPLAPYPPRGKEKKLSC